MPHPQHRYPVVASAIYPLWTVGEPNPEDDLTVLLDFTDQINERLAKAEALTRLLTHKDAELEYHPDAAWAIADLIGEARVLHNKQWERMRQVVKAKS